MGGVRLRSKLVREEERLYRKNNLGQLWPRNAGSSNPRAGGVPLLCSLLWLQVLVYTVIWDLLEGKR